MKLTQFKNKGFSLIEVIIAFSILTITVLGATNLISNSIQNNQENIIRVQAYFLAQEGLELTRAYRDTLWLKSENFLPTGTYYFNFPENSPNLEPINTNSANLYLNNNQFTHDNLNNNQNSLFQRTISVTSISDLDKDLNFTAKRGVNSSNIKNEDANFNLEKSARKITSKVEYEFNQQTKSIELTTILTDWKQI